MHAGAFSFSRNRQYMKMLNWLIIPLVFTACGTDSDMQTQSDGNNNGNAAHTPYVTQLEFPRISSNGKRKVIIHEVGSKMNYAVEWDYNRKTQRWTCYTLTPDSYANNGNSRRNLWPKGDPWDYDPNIDSQDQQAISNELSKSYFPDDSDAYYEKGHICPSADRLATKEENEQTYLMTNILPMVHNFNAGVWEKMETQVRKWLGNTDSREWSGFCDTLFVCKGGTISEDKILGYTVDQAKVNNESYPHPGHHPIPRYYFMALLAKKGNTYHALGFWVEHTNQPYSKTDGLGNYVVNIRKLEQQTGLDFFCNLPDDIEEKVENVTMEEIRRFWGL